MCGTNNINAQARPGLGTENSASEKAVNEVLHLINDAVVKSTAPLGYATEGSISSSPSLQQMLQAGALRQAAIDDREGNVVQSRFRRTVPLKIPSLGGTHHLTAPTDVQYQSKGPDPNSVGSIIQNYPQLFRSQSPSSFVNDVALAQAASGLTNARIAQEDYGLSGNERGGKNEAFIAIESKNGVEGPWGDYSTKIIQNSAYGSDAGFSGDYKMSNTFMSLDQSALGGLDVAASVKNALGKTSEGLQEKQSKLRGSAVIAPGQKMWKHCCRNVHSGRHECARDLRILLWY